MRRGFRGLLGQSALASWRLLQDCRLFRLLLALEARLHGLFVFGDGLARFGGGKAEGHAPVAFVLAVGASSDSQIW